MNEKDNLCSIFTSSLELSKPVKRFWASDSNEDVPISSFDELVNRGTLIVSTKTKFTHKNSESLEANMGRLRADKKLIETYIATRKELKRELFITPGALRHGQDRIL